MSELFTEIIIVSRLPDEKLHIDDDNSNGTTYGKYSVMSTPLKKIKTLDRDLLVSAVSEKQCQY